MAVYTALYVAATYAHLPFLLVQVTLPILWITLIAAPRLHDFDRSGWWGFAPMAVGFVGGFVLGFWKATGSPGPDVLTRAGAIELLINALFSLAFMIWLGAVRGNAGPNRFGLPPGATTTPDVARVFD
jgi:uncharacterized membrane protein YhaH (DUF805 family)